LLEGIYVVLACCNIGLLIADENIDGTFYCFSFELLPSEDN
jgi:hypothetical protein